MDQLNRYRDVCAFLFHRINIFALLRCANIKGLEGGVVNVILNETIGMKRTGWIALGVLSILAGVSLLMQAPETFAARPPDKQVEFVFGTAGLVGLCGVFAIACFFPRSHPITLRIIGALGVVSCMFSIYSVFHNSDLGWIGILSRLILTLVFWLPVSVYLLVKGRLSNRL